ncbi:hypothetical Protein YC6258_01341 [Gynuella sunshinyii YC6258]|uniref:Uncharacterized protein n=2 Tax=Gynuella sunshinyii TaxID=1445505 RepID=A0A0C5VJ21_9GAMM|nr:hypothetical Protein YC6258_01341 [Gynuella sunshinyii YC6258]
MAEENSPKNVGVLIKSLSEEETIEVDLTYRESCNKIIHATKVNFDYSDSDPHFGGSLNPIVHLYGEHYKYSWKAVLNIENFIESAWNHG